MDGRHLKQFIIRRDHLRNYSQIIYNHMDDNMKLEIIYEVGSITNFIKNHSVVGGSLVSTHNH